jgi:hypothetical protein
MLFGIVALTVAVGIALSKEKRHRLFLPIIYFLIVAPFMKTRFASGPLYFVDVLLVIAIASAFLLRNVEGLWATVYSTTIVRRVSIFLAAMVPSFLVGILTFGVIASVFVYLRFSLALSIVFVALIFLNTEERVQYVATVLALLAVTSALNAVIQVLWPDFWLHNLSYFIYPSGPDEPTFYWTMHRWTDPGFLRRAFGGYGNAANYGGGLAMITPLVLYKAIVADTRSKKLRWGMAALIVATALVLTWTRHAWMTVIFGVFGFVTLKYLNQRREGYVVLTISLLLVAAFFTASLAPPIQENTDEALSRLLSVFSFARDQDFLARIARFDDLLQFYLNYPLFLLSGSGHSTLFAARRYIEVDVEAARIVRSGFLSNSVFLVLYNYGVVSFVLFLGVLVFLLRMVFLYAHKATRVWTRENALLMCIVVGMFNMISDNYMHVVAWQQATFWLLVGLFFASHNVQAETVQRPIQFSLSDHT